MFEEKNIKVIITCESQNHATKQVMLQNATDPLIYSKVVRTMTHSQVVGQLKTIANAYQE
jgi:predicted acetyltransferase